MKVMVLGLDGATWDLLLRMIEQGKMRNLKRAMEIGSWGVLQSTLPPLSPVAWTSFATGKNPGKHRVLDFTRLRDGRAVPVDSTWIDSLTLWEIISSYGKKVGLVNVPMTYPLSNVNGYMVAGMMTPRDAPESTQPAALKAEIDEIVGEYIADPYTKEGRSEGFLTDILHWVRKKEEVCQYLLGKYEWDFFMNVVRAPDLVQHYFYDVLDPSHPQRDEAAVRRYGSLLEGIYNACDQVVRNRLEMLDGQTILLIVSDHGFGPASHWFEVNRFLMDTGVLILREAQGLRKLIGARVDLSLIAKLDFLDLRHRLFSTSTRILTGGLVDRALSAGAIDWSRTKAYCHSAGGMGIRVNLVGREPHGVVPPAREYEEVRDLVREELARLRDPETGQRVVSRVYLREEVFNGPHLDETPDLIFSLDNGLYIARDSLSAKCVLAPMPRKDWSGGHRAEGILVAAGSHVGSGMRLTSHSILDLAPTILWAMGLPIPWDMDGVPTEDAFDTHFVEANPVRLEESAQDVSRSSRGLGYSGEEEEVLERLRNLGYL